MKKLSIILTTLLFTSCTVSGNLNRNIDKSQRESLTGSPFVTANSMKVELKVQKKYRDFYLTELNNALNKYSNDTLILTEGYNFICEGCKSDYIQIFIKDTMIVYQQNLTDKTYTMSKEILSNHYNSSGYYYSDISELKKEISKESQWNSTPEKYGTDNCFDGGHTFYTVFYPKGKLESMYMRCWTPKEYRKTN